MSSARSITRSAFLQKTLFNATDARRTLAGKLLYRAARINQTSEKSLTEGVAICINTISVKSAMSRLPFLLEFPPNTTHARRTLAGKLLYRAVRILQTSERRLTEELANCVDTIGVKSAMSRLPFLLEFPPNTTHASCTLVARQPHSLDAFTHAHAQTSVANSSEA